MFVSIIYLVLLNVKIKYKKVFKLINILVVTCRLVVGVKTDFEVTQLVLVVFKILFTVYMKVWTLNGRKQL